jgi:hypothetical protein
MHLLQVLAPAAEGALSICMVHHPLSPHPDRAQVAPEAASSSSRCLLAQQLFARSAGHLFRYSDCDLPPGQSFAG